MSEFEYERPDDLLRRLKLGREEAMQRMLTSLILGGPYPKWNVRSVPRPHGIAFLREMYVHCFGEPWPGDDFVFVDEYELCGRTDAEKGGAPDWAVLWADRVWLIELKSERSSHRPAQIPLYFALGRHHHPDCHVDITYLTPTMSAPHTVSDAIERYAHLTWSDVVGMIRAAWPSPSSDAERSVVDGVIAAIDQLGLKPGVWRSQVLVTGLPDTVSESTDAVVTPEASVEPDVGTPVVDVIEAALELARATAVDGKQRALDVRFDSLESLLEARVQLRRRIAEEPVDAPVRYVMAWRWREQSTGAPLTDGGRASGYELRFSKYTTPQV